LLTSTLSKYSRITEHTHTSASSDRSTVANNRAVARIDGAKGYMLDEDWQKTPTKKPPYLVKEPPVPQNYQKYFVAIDTGSASMAIFANSRVSARWM
jgi:hypothetical protein